MDSRPFFAGEPPERPRVPRWKLLRTPTNGFPVMATIVSSNVVPVETHWFQKTRVLCAHDSCPPDLHVTPRRWYGYFQAISPKIREIVLLEVPEDTFRQIKELTLDNSNSCRGLCISLERVSQKKTSAIQVTLREILRGTRALPDEIDVWPMIFQLFKVK